MRKFVFILIALAIAGFTLFWVLTEPEAAVPAQDSGAPDLANGRVVFLAGGCASCHATPGQRDKLLLGGGLGIESPAGTFTAPNISPDPDHGIGRWTGEQFAAALLKGVSPDGRHYYPAFPYTSYQGMKPEDVRDLHAFIRTLAPSANVPPGHDFPLDLALVRRGMGLWKLLHFPGPSHDAADMPEPLARGRYLVETLGHCAECHSPRDMTGGIVASRRMGGGELPDGDEAPNLTPGKGGLDDWTEEDLTFFLADGTTPDGDVAGGEMARVIANTGQLPEADRAAMAAYLKSLQPIDD